MSFEYGKLSPYNTPTLNVCALHDEVIEIAQILAWLGCALRTARLSKLETSSCRIWCPEGTPNNHSTLTLEFSEHMLPETESSCWTNLFDGQVIASNFPVASRDFHDGQPMGLEIPIHMMAALGGASHIVEFKGGVLMKGFSSMFIPLSCGENFIQWHYICKEDDSRMPYLEAALRYPKRALLQDVSLDDVKKKRAFLGWAGSSTYHLGSSDSNYCNIDWSNTKEPKRSLEFHGGSLGFQNIGTGELNFVPGLRDGKLHISRSGPYQRIVKHASRTSVVFYDPGEQRAWLVPASAAIAHLSQTRRYREKYQVGGKAIEFVPTEISADLFDGAEKMLFKNASLKLSDDDAGGLGYYFRDLVLNIWSMLEAVMDEDIRKETTQRPSTNVPIKQELRGWECMDIVDERATIRQKSTKIPKSHGGWIDFATDMNAIVLFASGLEDLIQPSEAPQLGLCHMWQRVPKHKHYLTTSVSMLNRLYEEAGSKLTKEHLTSTRLKWQKTNMLFETCPNRGRFSCRFDRTQQIVRESSITLGAVNPPGALEAMGAVVFGNTRHSLPLKRTKPEQAPHSIYSQSNVTILQAVKTEDSPATTSEMLCSEAMDLTENLVEPLTEMAKPHVQRESTNDFCTSLQISASRGKRSSRKRLQESWDTTDDDGTPIEEQIPPSEHSKRIKRQSRVLIHRMDRQ